MKIKLNKTAIFIFTIIATLGSTSMAGSEMYLRCRPSVNCVIGDYVFDNTGIPITTQICTVNIYNPSGDLVVAASGDMTATADGWHYRTVNITSPLGLYRALMTCNNAGDTGYQNKTFYVGSDLEDIDTNVTNSIADLETSIKTADNYDLGDIVSYVDTLETQVGTAADAAGTDTIFGHIADVQASVDALGTIDADIADLMAKWGTYSATDIYNKVKNLSDEIDDVNVVSDVEDILDLSDTNENDMKELKNSVMAMKALVEVNTTLLEKVSTEPVIKTWLEEGSIIFKTMITNPAKNSSQTIPLKYYLPKELSEEDIIKYDPGITIEYDMEQEAYYVSGEFELDPGETKTISVETNDIWRISDEQIDSYRKQTANLVQPLKNTSSYAQATLISSDIETTLDKIQRLQNEVNTPQGKIRAYRDAQIELKAMDGKLEVLKGLVASSGANGALFGFIGGIQTFATWGIIIVLISGFVFLALYIRKLSSPQAAPVSIPMKNRFNNNSFPLKKFLLTVVSALLLFSIFGLFFFKILPNIRNNSQEIVRPLGENKEK